MHDPREADYDQLPYDYSAFPDTHPDRLCTVARLFGMRPAPADRCRVLEIGSALGGNLAPMAAQLRGSQFVGIDQSAQQIEAGLREAATLGLDNLQLLALDVRDLPPDLGEFDYVLCHGVYSWVPRDVQDAILAVCRRHLAPQGVAYVSYNTLPGWHARGMVRDILRQNTPPDGAPEIRVARARSVTRFLVEHLPEDSVLSRWLKLEVGSLDWHSDAYLLYEHLVEINEPLWFRDFVERAGEAGLGYLGDAEFTMMMPHRFGREATERLAALSDSQMEMEQYIDLLSTRFFRRTLLCHAEVELDRQLGWQRVVDLRAASPMAPADAWADPLAEEPLDFHGPGESQITVRHPLTKAAMCLLADTFPADLSTHELARRARERIGGDMEPADVVLVAECLLELYAQGLIQLSTLQRAVATTPWPRPVATWLARRQAALHAGATTNLRHENVPLDQLDHLLLPLCDGTREREVLSAAVVAAVQAGALQMIVEEAPVTDPEMVSDVVDGRLLAYVERCLLTTDDEVSSRG